VTHVLLSYGTDKPAKKKKMKLAWIYAEKKRRQFCQTMDINATEKSSIKEYLEQRTGETM